MRCTTELLGRRRFTGLAAAAAATGLGFGTTPETASAQTVEWQRTYDIGTGAVFADDVTPTSDGGYALLLTSIDFFGDGGAQVLLAKLDANGELEWSRGYEEGERDDFGVAVVELADGGYAVAATNDVFAADSEVWLLLTDDEGEVRRSQTYADVGGNAESAADLVEVRRNGETAGLTVLGTVNASGGENVRLRHVGTDLATVWERTYEGDGDETAAALVRPANGGYTYAATASADDSSQSACYVLGRTDDEGVSRWTRTYDGTGDATGLAETTDGTETTGYAVVGTVGAVAAGDADVRVVATDCRGNEALTETFDRGGTSDVASDIASIGDGFAIFGRSYVADEAGSADDDYWSVRTDENLDLRWVEIYDYDVVNFGQRFGSHDWSDALAVRGDELTLAGSTLSDGDADTANPWVVNVLDE